MSEKKRLDCLIFDLGLAESREKAKTMIMMGNVMSQIKNPISLEPWFRRMQR